jgi:hypothetical protein
MSKGTSAILTRFLDFPESLHANTAVVPCLDCYRCISRPVQFIFILHSTLTCREVAFMIYTVGTAFGNNNEEGFFAYFLLTYELFVYSTRDTHDRGSGTPT